jgi:hypothetical protein
MDAAPVVILSEPSDEPQALRVAHVLAGLGVRCWVEGVEGQDAMTRSQALAGCRAVVAVLDEGGGAYGAIDAGATWKVPVFLLGREVQGDPPQLRLFCKRVAVAAGVTPSDWLVTQKSPGPWRLGGPSRRAVLAVGAVLGVAAALGALGVMLPRTPRAQALLARHEAIGLTASQTATGWALYFQLPAPPVELWYELGEGSGFRQTGAQPGAFDTTTGAPLAKSYVMVSQEELPGPTTVRVKFRRAGGSLEGPFELRVDPDAQAQAQARSALEDLAPSWIAFDEFQGQARVYFTPVLTFKHALQEIRVGVDDGPLDQGVRFKPSRRPGLDTDDELYRALPAGARSVSVELVLRDGSRLPVRTFPVTVARTQDSVPSPPHPPRTKMRTPRPSRDIVDPWETRLMNTRN